MFKESISINNQRKSKLVVIDLFQQRSNPIYLFDKKHYNSDRFQEWIKLSERYFNSKLDSHTIVEKWMIATNKIAPAISN